MMIENFENFENVIRHNTLHTDYKATIIASNIIKYFKDVDQVFLKRLGGNNRSFHKDVVSATSQMYELDEMVVSLGSYREGIYDYLPEGVFHPPSFKKESSRIEDVIVQMQKQKKIESDARKFFEPFELETYFLELNAIAKENEFEITGNSTLLLQTVKELWPLLDALDQYTAKIFIYLLPFFHEVRANKRWFEKCLTAFLQVPVQVSFEANHITDIDEASNFNVLSKFRLGVSTVLSGSHMNGERNWVIHFGPIPYESISSYVPNSDLRKLLQVLYDYCLPVTVEVREYFITDREKQSFLLDKTQNTNRLGFSTFL